MPSTGKIFVNGRRRHRADCEFRGKAYENNTTGEYFVEEADPPFEENVERQESCSLRRDIRTGKDFLF